MSKDIFYKVQMRGKDQAFPSRWDIAVQHLDRYPRNRIRLFLVQDQEVDMIPIETKETLEEELYGARLFPQ